MGAFGDTKCSRQDDGRLKKSGPRVREEEFKALQHARHLGVAVPAAHQFSSSELSIWMDHVEGETLEDLWPTMSEDEKKSIARQLGRFISLMRSDGQQEVSIGSIDGPALDRRHFQDYTGGPFTNEADFNAFLFNLYPQTPRAIKENLAAMMRSDHRICFTHGDLAPSNIIIKNGVIQALVDWELSGWYPEYYEYVKFFECLTNCKGWRDFANDVFEEAYGGELVVYQAMLQWQRA